jgi:hypothetical protein
MIEKKVFAAGDTGHLFWSNIGRKRYLYLKSSIDYKYIKTNFCEQMPSLLLFVRFIIIIILLFCFY